MGDVTLTEMLPVEGLFKSLVTDTVSTSQVHKWYRTEMITANQQ